MARFAEGEGYTVNIPWEVAANAKSPPADVEMLYAFDRLVMPYLGFLWPMAQGGRYGDMIPYGQEMWGMTSYYTLNIHEPGLTLGLMSLSPNICAIGSKLPLLFCFCRDKLINRWRRGYKELEKPELSPTRAETKKKLYVHNFLQTIFLLKLGQG